MLEEIYTAGRQSVEYALFALYPIFVIALVPARVAEGLSLFKWLVRRFESVISIAGLSSYSALAALQITFIGVAGPVATLRTMTRQGVSDREMATTLAMLLAMAPANITYPLFALGLDPVTTLTYSATGGITAAFATRKLFGCRLSSTQSREVVVEQVDRIWCFYELIKVVRETGFEALKLAVFAIPFLIAGNVAHELLNNIPEGKLLAGLAAQEYSAFPVEAGIFSTACIKFIAGGNSILGVIDNLSRAEIYDASAIYLYSPLIASSLDVVSIIFLMSAARANFGVWKPAALGAFVGVLVRQCAHMYL